MLNVRQEGRVLFLELNRPEKRNALNGELCVRLALAIEAGNRDRSVGAILLSGAGKSFCSGMDLTERDKDLEEAHERLFTIRRRISTPVIAAVHGAALAGGMGLAAMAHMVIASEDATFGLTEIRIGLWPFVIFRAIELAVGERRAVELALTGRILTAGEAEAIGLAHQVTAAAEFEGRARALAAAVADSSWESMRIGLWFVEETRGLDWDQAGAIARRARRELLATPDFEEGVRAFREKRLPEWPSHSPL
jgi:enoyl-CoA hydratase/carnithine racemase